MDILSARVSRRCFLIDNSRVVTKDVARYCRLTQLHLVFSLFAVAMEILNSANRNKCTLPLPSALNPNRLADAL